MSVRSRRALVKVSIDLCFRAEKCSILELLEEMWNLERQKCDRVGSTLAEKSRTCFLATDMKFWSILEQEHLYQHWSKRVLSHTSCLPQPFKPLEASISKSETGQRHKRLPTKSKWQIIKDIDSIPTPKVRHWHHEDIRLRTLIYHSSSSRI